jgi:hypothetical protein
MGRLSRLGRSLHALGVIAIATFVVVPAIPDAWTGGLSGTLGSMLRPLSLKQTWRMYAPDPQRAQSYMKLTARYPDGRERELEETEQARAGWETHFAWHKTRVDIWRYYALAHPKGRNDNRTWYLKGVCVREARRGDIPEKIVMHQVRRRFPPPDKARQGAGLGRPRESLVTVQYCKTPEVLGMIESDRQRRGQAVSDEGA